MTSFPSRRVAGLVIACSWTMVREPAAEYPKLAPYSETRWTPEVRVEGRWYVLRSVDGQSVDAILEFARRAYDSRWQKRFDEDLVQVLTEMGHPPSDTVRLELLDVETGRKVTFDDVPLTAENRRAIWMARQRGGGRPVRSRTAEAEAQQVALGEFEAALEERWSYRHANDSDFEAALARLRNRLESQITTDEFGIELQRILALGIDGHARVRGYSLPAGGRLPFLVEPEGERFVAFSSDRTGFLSEGLPYLTRIDGREVADWCDAAASLVPKGSPQYRLRHCLRYLRELDYLRGLMELPKNETVEIELADESGGVRRRLSLQVGERRPLYGVWPHGGSRHLPGGIGYLRLARMDDEAVREIETWMPRFRDTTGLIVDVRDNPGGSRAALRALYAYLVGPEDPPRPFTAAAYRLHPDHGEDHLAARSMYRSDAEVWTERERRAIEEFAEGFEPEWELPDGEFSDWHYMVLSPVDVPDRYVYDEPVIVLMNSKCFSATDVFLAGLKGMNDVTLLGTPSGGGSARSVTVRLQAAPLEVRLGSMASFQADGHLFDGRGVRPDVTVVPVPEYHIGGRDNVLEEAMHRIGAAQSARGDGESTPKLAGAAGR